MRRREEKWERSIPTHTPEKKKRLRLVDKTTTTTTPTPHTNTMMRKLFRVFDLFFLGLHFPPRSRTCDRYSPSAHSGKRFL